MSDTRPDLAAIKARAEAATPGEWFVDTGRDVGDHIWWQIPDVLRDRYGRNSISSDDEATVRHIAGMDPATTLALVAYAERCEAETAQLRAAAERVAGKAERTAYAAAEDEGHVEPEAWRAMAADLRAALTPDAAP